MRRPGTSGPPAPWYWWRPRRCRASPAAAFPPHRYRAPARRNAPRMPSIAWDRGPRRRRGPPPAGPTAPRHRCWAAPRIARAQLVGLVDLDAGHTSTGQPDGAAQKRHLVDVAAHDLVDPAEDRDPGLASQLEVRADVLAVAARARAERLRVQLFDQP